jgi:nucleoside 2-deoxyribosyltransferase
MRLTGSHIFLAAPYSQWIDPTSGLVHRRWHSRLESLRRHLIQAGASVYSAHHNESWGACLFPPHRCTPLDFGAVKLADTVCAVLGRPVSGGVCVELGWASALGKPILLIMEPETPCTPLITGLGTVAAVRQIDAPQTWHAGFLGSVVSALHELPAPSADAGRPALGYTDVGFVGSLHP